MPQANNGLFALYLRRSRADIEREKFEKFDTLKSHERELTKAAKAQGIILDKPYYKELASGEHIADRPVFQELMQKISEGKYKGIMVHEISRLGRGEPREYGHILFTIKSLGILIATLYRVFDPSNPDDYRQIKTEMFLSNMEFDNIVWRLGRGTRTKAEIGCFLKPTPPFGYDRYKRPQDGNWSLTQNSDAPLVKQIFDYATQGRSLGFIARTLNNAGLRTPTDKYWSAGRVRSIITNPHYKGYIRYGYYRRREVPSEGYKTKKIYSTNENCILVKGLHDGIVSEEEWEKANSFFSSSPVNKNRELKNPLAGLLVCKKCGHPMVRFLNKVKSNGNLIEHYRHPPFKECKMHGARMSLVIDLLCETLKEISNDLEIVVENNQIDETEGIKETLEIQLADIEKKNKKVMELYFSDAIPVEEVKEMRFELEKRKKEIEEELSKLSKPKKTPREIHSSINKAIEMLKDESVSVEAKNSFLKGFIDKIEYENYAERNQRSPGKIRLTIILKG